MAKLIDCAHRISWSLVVQVPSCIEDAQQPDYNQPPDAVVGCSPEARSSPCGYLSLAPILSKQFRPSTPEDHPPMTWTTMLRLCGDLRCSNRYSPCQVPSARWPLMTGTVRLVCVMLARMCDVMSSGPSSVCR